MTTSTDLALLAPASATTSTPPSINSPPTKSPPTDPPPINSPPINSPPIDSPPTDSPPRDSPPTDSPPTDSPPTDSPPTNPPSPATASLATISSPTITPTLTTIFGSLDQIDRLIESFNYSKIKDSNSGDYLRLDLAPSYGKLAGDITLKRMDNHLKIMITGTMKLLSTMTSEKRTWDNVISSMMQNPFLQPKGDDLNRDDKLIKKGTNVFKFDDPSKALIIKEVQTWFAKLIDDSDVLNSIKIDTLLADIVARTGMIIDSFQDFFMKKEKHEKDLVDISVLRFPDIEHPYFKIYRIKLEAWFDSERFLMFGEHESGITGEYFARKFKPRQSVIDSLKAEVKNKAIQQAEGIFG